MQEKELDHRDVYKNAEISRQTWSNIISEKNGPSPQNARKLVIGLHCTVPEAEKLLAYCGYSFVEGCEYDDCIKYCLEHHIYKDVDVQQYVATHTNLFADEALST